MPRHHSGGRGRYPLILVTVASLSIAPPCAAVAQTPPEPTEGATGNGWYAVLGGYAGFLEGVVFGIGAVNFVRLFDDEFLHYRTVAGVGTLASVAGGIYLGLRDHDLLKRAVARGAIGLAAGSVLGYVVSSEDRLKWTMAMAAVGFLVGQLSMIDLTSPAEADTPMVHRGRDVSIGWGFRF